MSHPEAPERQQPVTSPVTAESLAEMIARIVPGVPGVALLKPGLGELLRTSGRAGISRLAGKGPAGIRVHRRDRTGPWEVQVHIVIHRGHRALDVARAVRDAVTTELADLTAGGGPVHVTVTVTNAI